MSDQRSLRSCLADTIGVIIVLWVVELIDVILRGLAGRTLDVYGVVPRTVHGLFGIVCAPFLHGGWQHLIANSTTLLVLGTVALRYSRKLTSEALIAAWLGSGILTWCIGGAGTVHIGASGVIFGLLGFLLANGVFRREIGAFVLAVVIFLLYGGALFGVLPTEQVEKLRISWPMHLGGLLGGILASWHLRNTKA